MMPEQTYPKRCIMPSWYEVFDNEHVQLATRRQAALLTGLAIAMIVLTVALFVLGGIDVVPFSIIGLLLAVAWICTAQIIAGRLRLLRCIVWCVKLSDQKIVGYNYARRKTALDWLHVRRIELNRNGLTIVGRDTDALAIPHLFPDFPRLSHRVVEYAESYGIPVFVDGQPWQNLDIYQLFPFLAEADNPDAWH